MKKFTTKNIVGGVVNNNNINSCLSSHMFLFVTVSNFIDWAISCCKEPSILFGDLKPFERFK